MPAIPRPPTATRSSLTEFLKTLHVHPGPGFNTQSELHSPSWSKLLWRELSHIGLVCSSESRPPVVESVLEKREFSAQRAFHPADRQFWRAGPTVSRLSPSPGEVAEPGS